MVEKRNDFWEWKGLQANIEYPFPEYMRFDLNFQSPKKCFNFPAYFRKFKNFLQVIKRKDFLFHCILCKIFFDLRKSINKTNKGCKPQGTNRIFLYGRKDFFNSSDHANRKNLNFGFAKQRLATFGTLNHAVN
jgi:hypothetical protein